MFAGSAFASVAFAAYDYVALDTDDFVEWLANVRAERCWLLEVDALSLAEVDAEAGAFASVPFASAPFAAGAPAVAAGEVTQYWSTHGFRSAAADTPASTWYDGRLAERVRIERRIAGRDGIGGLASVRSEVSLANVDGALDLLTRHYALDGRRARVLIGPPDDARSEFGTVFVGVVESATIGDDVVRLRLTDGLSRLKVPVNATAYAGSGALEGGADLTGKAKPRCWGSCLNVSPPLVDSARLIYQVNDGAISDVPAVYDRGIALTQGSDYSSESDLNTTAPSAGQYRVYKAGGYFRLGSTPSGTVTADVLGDASGTGYVSTAAQIVSRILVDEVGLASDEIEPASFDRLQVEAAGIVGVWAGTAALHADEAIDDLLAGVGAYGGFNRHGAFTVGLVRAAEGASDAAYTDEEVIHVTREPRPAALEPVAWRVGVGYARNYTVQGDLAAAVTAARRTFAAEAERVAIAEDSTIRSRHRLAREYRIPAAYEDEADASDEADRQFVLWGGSLAPYRVALPAVALVREIGDDIQITHARHGMADGVPAFVLGVEVEGTDVTLQVLA